MMMNGGFWSETRWVCERDEWTRQWTVKMFEGKLKSFLKTVLKSQNTRFSWLRRVANKSPDQVARHLWDKIWNICLSVFCDWKVHPRGSHKGSRETFWVRLMIGAFTHKQVTKLSRVKSKTHIFEKISNLFHDWEFDPPESHENLLCKLATGLTHEASRQNRTAQFLKFLTFFKTKYFSKTIKTLKNLFLFD